MQHELVALKLFASVARTGSFSQAAKELSLSQPTASRMITQLEKQLGTVLVIRTTRATKLTDAGEDYLERILRVLDALDEANASVRGTGEIRGVLRIGLSSIFASEIVVPRLGDFMAAHPALRLELRIDDRRQHLINERVDVAIRFGKLSDSSATARRLGSWPLVLAAAPSYLERHGRPTQPSELASHRVINSGPAIGEWRLSKGKRQVTIAVASDLAIDSSEVGIRAGIAGLGIVAATLPGLQGAIDRGELEVILSDWRLGDIDVHALYPSGQGAKPAAKLFVEFLAQSVAPPSTRRSVPVT